MNHLKKFICLLPLFVLVLSGTITARAEYLGAKQSYDELSFMPGQVIVGMRNDRNQSRSALNNNLFPGIDIANIEVLAGGNTNARSGNHNSRQILLLNLEENSKQSVKDAIYILEQHPDVEYAEPDYVFYSDHSVVTDLQNFNSDRFEPNDPIFPQLWGMERIQAPEAWSITTGDTSIRVGVIDSGIEYTHLDLARNVDASLGFDFVLNRPSAMDVRRHGTHTAGTIGAVGDNGIGVVGVAMDVTMIPLRVLNEDGNGFASNIVRAIDYANSLNLDILNYSISGNNHSRAMEDSIRAFNGLFVASASNEGRDIDVQPRFPASLDIPNMISVGNSTQSDRRAADSGFGRRSVDLFAPGSAIISTGRNHAFRTSSGTSRSVPHVTGAAVLALSVNPSLSPVELREAILNTVDPVPALANLSVSGGILNVRKLVEYVMEEVIEEAPEVEEIPEVEVTPEVEEIPELPEIENQFDPSRIYLAGDVVFYQGNLYQANWWTRGGSPSTSAAWTPIPIIHEDGSVDFRLATAFVGGDLVRHEGRLYRARWWTQGVIPTGSSAWEFIGYVSN